MKASETALFLADAARLRNLRVFAAERSGTPQSTAGNLTIYALPDFAEAKTCRLR